MDRINIAKNFAQGQRHQMIYESNDDVRMKNIRFTHKEYVDEKIPVYEEIASLIIKYIVLNEIKNQIKNSFVIYEDVITYEKQLKDYENKIFGSMLSAFLIDIRNVKNKRQIYLELRDIVKKLKDKKISRQEALGRMINELIQKVKTSIDLLDKITSKEYENLGTIFTKRFIKQIQTQLRRHLKQDFDDIIHNAISEVKGLITVQGDEINIDIKKLKKIINNTKIQIENKLIKDKDKNFNVKIANLLKRYAERIKDIDRDEILKDDQLLELAVEIASKVWKLNLSILILVNDVTVYDNSKTINLSTLFNTLKQSVSESTNRIRSLVIINEDISGTIKKALQQLKSMIYSVIDSMQSMWQKVISILTYNKQELDRYNKQLEQIYSKL